MSYITFKQGVDILAKWWKISQPTHQWKPKTPWKMIDRSTEPMSEWSLGENPNANSVDLGGCEDKRERNWEVQGKMPRNSDYVNVPTPPGILSTFQLLNISASQHLDISTSLLRVLRGILLNLFYVVHTRNGVTKLFGISTSPISTFTKLKLGSGPSIYCRSLVLGIWCPVMLGAHKNPCLDFPFIHPRPPIGRFRRKKQRISHSGRIISGSKGLRFIIWVTLSLIQWWCCVYWHIV